MKAKGVPGRFVDFFCLQGPENSKSRGLVPGRNSNSSRDSEEFTFSGSRAFPDGEVVETRNEG